MRGALGRRAGPFGGEVGTMSAHDETAAQYERGVLAGRAGAPLRSGVSAAFAKGWGHGARMQFEERERSSVFGRVETWWNAHPRIAQLTR